MSILQIGLPGAPELLVLFVVLAILFALAYSVYTDAERRGEDHPAFWALAVGALTLFTFFGGLLALAIDVWQRGSRVAV